jgi:hypothetical protein
MESDRQRKTVAKIFADEAAAAKALERLIEEHFDIETEVSVIVSHRHEREEVPIRSDFHVGRNASIGAATGAVLAGVGVAAVGLTAGPFTLIAAGPILAALETAYVGGPTGFGIGALVSIDVVEPEATGTPRRGKLPLHRRVGPRPRGQQGALLQGEPAPLRGVRSGGLGLLFALAGLSGH